MSRSLNALLTCLYIKAQGLYYSLRRVDKWEMVSAGTGFIVRLYVIDLFCFVRLSLKV